MTQPSIPGVVKAKGSGLELALARQIHWLGLPPPVAEHRFHPARRWRFDLAWPEHKLAVEVEGGTWVSGRHNRGAGMENDCVKYAEAVLLGWRVLRVTSNMVDDGRAATFVERALSQRL